MDAGPGLSAEAATVRPMTTALYRRYRPQTFGDVIGQEHVTEPLMQALRTGRVGHAYLFSGPRGCGKTTSARILARCLNCERGPTAEPCGECPSCVALARGGAGSVDVIEIDAASHGGVDDARDLREKAAYGPAQSRYKVYIIDEAHMVTPQGFNALLKIVEEPPEHVKFVFATTEPEKVIGTIRSRTHHYPFRLVPPARLEAYLQELCGLEGIAAEPGVLSFVVRAGAGSVRDSLSVLDQLIAGSGDDGLTYAGAATLLGFTSEELLDATVDALAAGDGAGVFRQVDRVVETGQDPRRFVEDVLQRLRDLLVLAAVGADPSAASALFRSVPQDQLARMTQQAVLFGPGQLSYAADTVNAGLTEMTGATSPRLQLELILARLLLPGAAGERGYAARLDRLERRLEMSASPEGPVSGRSSAPRSGQLGRERVTPADTPPAAPGPSAPAPGQTVGPVLPPSAGVDGSPIPAARAAGSPALPEEAQAPALPEEAQAPAPAGGAGALGRMDTEAIRRNWPDVLATIFTMRRVTWTFLSSHAQVLDYDGQRLLLGIATQGLTDTFRHGTHAEIVRQALSERLGLDAHVEAVTQGASGVGQAAPQPGVRGDARGAESRRRVSRSSEPRGSELRGSELRGSEPRGPEHRGSGPHDAEPSGSERRGAEPRGPRPSSPRPSERTTPASSPSTSPDDHRRTARPRPHTTAPGPMEHVSAADEPPASEDEPPPPEDPFGGPAPAWDELPPDTQPPPVGLGGGQGQGRGRSVGTAGPVSPPAPAGLAAAGPGVAAPAAAGPGAAAPGAADERAGAEPTGLSAFRAARRSRNGPAGRRGGPSGPDGGLAGPSAAEQLENARPSAPPAAGDDDVSEDDEDIVDIGAVGQPVIAEVLGGVVIDEFSDEE